jgi:hypothetical protein
MAKETIKRILQTHRQLGGAWNCFAEQMHPYPIVIIVQIKDTFVRANPPW